jgi:hypothetical protein
MRIPPWLCQSLISLNGVYYKKKRLLEMVQYHTTLLECILGNGKQDTHSVHKRNRMENNSYLPLSASQLSPQYENDDPRDGSVATVLTSAGSMQEAGTTDTEEVFYSYKMFNNLHSNQLSHKNRRI